MTLVDNVLVLQFQELFALVQQAPGAENVLNLPIQRGALAHALRGEPPTPLAIERAIEVVEDALMPVAAQVRGAHVLHVRDATLHALARHAGVAPSGAGAITLGVDEVEALFNRLAARAAGRAQSQDGLPVDGVSAATLIVVREAMHHWGVGRVVVNGGS